MTEEQEQTKERTGWIITFLAAFLAITSLLDGGNSSQILDNTIEANNVWSFYQAKSIKQSLAEITYDNAVRNGDKRKAQIMKAKIERYESEPSSGCFFMVTDNIIRIENGINKRTIKTITSKKPIY